MTQPTSSATQDRPAAPADRRWMVLVVVVTAQLMAVKATVTAGMAALGLAACGAAAEASGLLRVVASDHVAELVPARYPELGEGPVKVRADRAR